ncbi:MAG: FtsQ-type POTRA domain-containing protein [Coriobacteriia bacterium]|nr:FtsQ-type POTRA domain-containing protein [Coriobacteriia bacterium]
MSRRDGTPPSPNRSGVHPGRRSRKRLEVTSRLDRGTTQLEHEVGLASDPAPGKKRPAAGKRQKKTKQDPPRQKGARTTGEARRQRSARMSEAQQLAERKRQQREVRKKKSSVRRVLLIIGVVALIAALIYGVNFAAHSSLFAVTDIQVTGNHLMTKNEVKTLAAIPSGSTTLLLSVRKTEKKLEENAWISSARVKRHLLHQVTIDIVERKPAAYVDNGTGKKQGWLISQDGVWLGTYNAGNTTISALVTGGEARALSSEESSSVVTIKDVEDPQFVMGAPSKNEMIKNTLAILNGVSPDLRAQIGSVSAPSVTETRLYLKNKVEVDIGAADPISDKDKIIRDILEQQKGKVNLINVLAVDKATWRGLDTAK